MQNQTIAAVSTPAGIGAVGMVRISGDRALEIAARVFRPNDTERSANTLSGYTGALGRICEQDGTQVDEAIIFVYRAPKSYTGEDIAELCCHGGMYAVQRTLRLCLDAGAVPAGPGEFTRRAFMNGKLGLLQAEAVMDIIGAQGQTAMRAALSALNGALSKEVESLSGELLARAAHIAAWCDYPEEDLVPVDMNELDSALDCVAKRIGGLLETYDRGKIVREGAAAAILGKPNVGKSTLMNLLCGEQRSIVTELPGTTRDVVRETVRVGGIVLNLLDTAGIRETVDVIEQIGVERSLAQLDAADIILAVFDRSEPLSQQDSALLKLLSGKNCIAVVNKCDLPPKISVSEVESAVPRVVEVSAASGEGRDELERSIAEALELESFDPAAALVTSERQRSSLLAAAQSLEQALDALRDGMTLDAVGACIQSALDELLSVSGKRVTDSVLDEVFSRFCVGK